MITFTGVAKRFAGRGGPVHALRGVTAHVPAGTITAVLGPNGSGKTTLLRILAGQLEPTSGAVAFDGRPVATDARIRYVAVAHDGNNIGEVSLRECLAFARSRPGWREHEYERLARRFELPGRGRLHRLSSGQQSAFAVAIALASAAPVVVVDEAHAGMDVPKRLALYEELVRANADEGRTVLIASHNVGELERIAEHVLVLRHGELLAATTVEQLTGRFARVTGSAEAVARAVGERPVVERRTLGPTHEATVDVSAAPLDPLREREGVVVAPVEFQDAFVALLADESHHAHASAQVVTGGARTKEQDS